MSEISKANIVFLGLGLISGSLAMALRSKGWQGRLSAWGPREASLEQGLNMSVIDHYDLDLTRALVGADVIVIGAPPVATGELLGSVLELIQPGDGQPVVTDLASIKGWVVERALPRYPRFVPGHPIAGSENSGVTAARADLFEGREAILTPDADTDPDALEWVAAMWRLAGSRVTTMAVADHDAALAASSHSPHMMAYALTMALADDPLNPMQHGGGALRDMTRIAASDAVMWRDVALTNRRALVAAIESVAGELTSLKELIAAQDGVGLEQYFEKCRSVRRAHDTVLNPLVEADAAPTTGSRNSAGGKSS